MIQIDIPMPKNCGECPICNEYLMCGVPCNGRGWGENDVSDYFTNGRPEWCPLKEQEATKPEEALMSFYKAARLFHCGNCHEMIVENQKYCHECGRFVKWE